MPAPKRKTTFSPVGLTAPSAGDAPAPAPRPAPVDTSDIASLHASNIGQDQAGEQVTQGISLDDFIAGRPDPDLDLVTSTVRIPRYLAEALRLTSQLKKRPAQYVVADALRAELPAELVARCRAMVERG